MSRVCYSKECPFHAHDTEGYDCAAAELCAGFCEDYEISYSNGTENVMNLKNESGGNSN